MPKYEITSPDGKRFEITAPDGATQDEVLAYAKKSFESQAQQGMQASTSQAPVEPKSDHGVGGFFDHVMNQVGDAGAAFGHHAMNAVHGGAQFVENGIASLANKVAPGSAAAKWLQDTAAADNAVLAQREKEYQAHTPDNAGSYAGAALGEIAPFVVGGPGSITSTIGKAGDLAAAAPRAIGRAIGPVGEKIGAGMGKILSGATQGGLFSLAAPAINNDQSYFDQKADQATLGALTGSALGVGNALAPAAQKAVAAIGNTVKPLTDSGRAQLIAKFLQENISQPETVAIDKLRNAPEYLPGSSPTAAQALGDGRLLSVERAAKLTQPYSTMFDDLAKANNAARVDALNEMAGAGGKYDYHVADRATVANKLYGQARAQPIDPASLTPEVNDSISKLMGRPSMKSAMADAKEKALEAGVKLDDTTSIQGLHYAKLSLDDKIESALRAGNNTQAKLLMGTKDLLSDVMEKLSPAYAEAKQTFAAMSKPINQMEQAQKIAKALQTAPEDTSGIPQLSRFKFDSGLAKVDPGVMTPEQMSLLENISRDLNRADQTNLAQRAVGSNTPQDLTNLGGIKKMLGNAPLLNKVPVIGRAFDGVVSDASMDLQSKLAQALINPEVAATSLESLLAKNPDLIKLLINSRSPIIQNAPQAAGYLVNR